MMKDLISVIVPIYNVQDYVEKCVQSICSQTYENIEIILVNDGSTDNSLNIINTFNDKRIIIVNKKNGGLSSARNAGIDVAKGNYLVFVDSDDYIASDMIRVLYDDIRSGNDISICNRYYLYENGKEKLRFPNNNFKIEMSSTDALRELILMGNFDMSAWAKMYRRSLFKNIRFPLNKLSEDYYIMFYLFGKSRKICYNSKPLYYYLQRKGSISKNKKLSMDYVYAARNQMEYIKNNFPKLENDSIYAYCISYLTVYDKVILNGGKIDNKVIIEFSDEILSYKNIILKNKNVKFTRKFQICLFIFSKHIYNIFLKIYSLKKI